MPSHGKQSILYTHTSGPNGWVAFVLEELGLTCHSIYLGFKKQEQKAPEHRKLNPNGRISMLIDHHNGDFVIWESNAILSHLVDKYDKDHKLTVADEKDQHRVTQWLFFPGPDKVHITAKYSGSRTRIPSVSRAQSSVTRRICCASSAFSPMNLPAGLSEAHARGHIVRHMGQAFPLVGLEQIQIGRCRRETQYPAFHAIVLYLQGRLPVLFPTAHI